MPNQSRESKSTVRSSVNKLESYKSENNKPLTQALSNWAALFSIQACISVAAGAFGAHALSSILDANALGWWHTGSQYLMYHSLAGLIVVVLSSYLPSCKSILALFFIGNTVFSGSLYVMALTGYTLLGAVTPIGGLCYLVAWGCLAWRLWRSTTPKATSD
jgi:uncharacterized membrane protein YgdD (TMEM256/DUF423 family)